MCNPPFYSSPEEVAKSAREKDLAPYAVCTGADVEMIFDNGGEEGFVGQMVEESNHFQIRCKWYTSMLGKMSSVVTIVENFRKRSITNYAITEFVQGRTRRWAVGWSFTDMHLPDSVARISSIMTGHPLYQLMPSRNTLTQSFPNCSFHILSDILDRNLRLLDGVLTNTNTEPVNSGVSSSSTLRTLLVEDATILQPSSTGQPTLTCSVCVIEMSNQAAEGQCLGLEVQWLYGTDRTLFDSFVSHLWRKVGDEVQNQKH